MLASFAWLQQQYTLFIPAGVRSSCRSDDPHNEEHDNSKLWNTRTYTLLLLLDIRPLSFSQSAYTNSKPKIIWNNAFYVKPKRCKNSNSVNKNHLSHTTHTHWHSHQWNKYRWWFQKVDNASDLSSHWHSGQKQQSNNYNKTGRKQNT